MSSKQKECIFCKIVKGEDPNTVIVVETENIVIFKDIRPTSTYHYLAVPKVHIENAKVLTFNDIPLGNQ